MVIIEVITLENGAHRNQAGDILAVPEGWAVIPNDMDTPNFPFGEVTTKKIAGVLTVTSWTASPIPEVKPLPEIEEPVSEYEQLRADVDYIAVMMGVDL